MEAYRQLGVMESIDAALAITKAPKLHAVGYCLGGTLLSIAAAAMGRDGDARLASASFLAAQVDFTEAGPLRLFINDSEVTLIEDMMAEKGYLSSDQMAGAFALLRARDAVIAEQGGLTLADRADLCAGFQAAVADVLAEKTRRALAEHPVAALAVAGGVAANSLIRAQLQSVCAASQTAFLAPPLALCTDNAAMIAWAGIERHRAGGRDDLTLSARPRWPLDQTSPALIGSGKKGAKA